MAKKQKWFQKTEKILYEYKTFDAAIRVLEAERTRLLGPLSEDIMPPLGTSVVKLGQGSTKTPFNTSQTERYGIKRAEISTRGLGRVESKLLKLKRQRDSIREARQTLPEIEQQFVWLKYDLEKTHRETRNALKQITVSMSESTYFRLRQKTLKKIAKFMRVI